ncbi:hypothetical protein A4G99_06840 [Haladaptatus sp. R4]|uniref:DUF7284 family protein n=1 Tax=Haladaptatus sp. R4 TaxID=1679489 RepID=UPI0007B48D49|nr:hypothetical protein [Haladaptatus sp. R4]KZN24157.1 hypothetical protein A4G99_06840 [Haladaptatus sp. R4]
MRAISTVVDVTLCLLLVSASAFVLVGAKPLDSPIRTRTAESTANVLETSTANVNYTISSDSGTVHPTTHGTLAEHLGKAALANTMIRGTESSPTSDSFERAVGRRVWERLGYPADVQLLVRWEPYRDSELGGRFALGESPPHDADVHAAVRSIPSGMPRVRTRALAAARRDGYRGVARVVAAGIVAGLVPNESTRLALRDRETGIVVARRFRRLIRSYDAVDSASPRLGSQQTRRALIDAMARTIESDIRRSFGTPTDAARSVAVGRTELVVRTWSA